MSKKRTSTISIGKTDKKRFLKTQGITRAPAGKEVDHKVPLEHGGSDSVRNLQLRTKKQHEAKTAREARARTNWDQFDALTDEEIRAGIKADPDAHPTNEDFWKTAKVVMPHAKETITIRLDPDVLEWFRKKGRGYQTRINAVLRSYIRARQD